MNSSHSDKLKNKKKWSVVPFSLADLLPLERFFKRLHVRKGEYGSKHLFQWRAVGNYIMPGIINLIKDKETIAATLSNTPKRLLVGGKAYVVSEIGDAMTDPSYRRQGMLSLLINKSTQDALEKGVDGVYSTPSTTTPSLQAFLKKGNYQPYAGLSINSLLFPVNLTDLIAKRSNKLIGRVFGLLLKGIVQTWYLYEKNKLKGSEFKIKRILSISENWDSFWEKAKIPYELVFVRDRQAMTYRYFESPDEYIFYTMVYQEQIIGYMVYRIQDVAGTKILTIADFLMLPQYQHNFKQFMVKVIDDALLERVNYINTWSVKGSVYYKMFRRNGYMPRNHLLLIWFQNEFALNIQNNFDKWHFTIGDSDNI